MGDVEDAMVDPSVNKDGSNRIDRARAAEIQEIYANGFSLAISSADMTIALERNGAPVAVLNLSYTLAKTLAVLVGRAVSEFETTVGREILTTEEVNTLMAKSGPEKS